MHFMNVGNQDFVGTFAVGQRHVELARVQWKRTS
jgi:hypothetical protein